MLPACRQELMINSLSSTGFNFHLPVDFGFIVLLPHNFSVLHQNRMVMHENPVTEAKTMQYSLDTSVSDALQVVSSRFGAGAHLCSKNKT